MALPTFSQIVNSMLSFLQISRPDINTNTGTVVNDVVVSTVANQLSAENGTSPSVYSSIAYVQDVQAFVDNAATLVPSDLDAIGANYGLTRLPAVAATGFITFRIRNFTTSSSTITVPSGTVVSTLATTQSPAVSFATTSTFTFSPALAPSYFNPATGFYENPTNSVTIVCQSTGTVGNVGAQTITSLVGPGLGIDAVTNTTATSGGTNIESNTAFAARIQIKLEGNNIGTPNGIISLVETNPNVVQALVVGPNDPEMQRDQFGGSVDVYIRGQVPLTVSDTPTYTTTGSQQFVLVNQPALSVGSVTGIKGGSPYTFVLNSDYQFVKNPNSLFAGSIDAASYITFDVQTFFTINTVGLPFTVTFVVSSALLNVSSTTGMTIGDVIVQGTNETTIVNIISGVQIQVGSTSGWAIGSAADTSVQQLVVSTTTGMSIGNTITQGNASTTVVSVSSSTVVIVANNSGFVTGSASLASFTGFKPDNNTVVTITYAYDSLIATLQALLNNPSNLIAASDVLIREAIEAFVNVTAGILIVPGYVASTVVANVETALSNYINGLGLGAVLILSELVTIIQNVPGVDEVDLSNFTVQSIEGLVTTTIPPGQSISVGKNAYTVANPPTIIVE